MHQARRRRGYSALLAALALIVTACGTRLPDNAFVNASSGGNGTAAETIAHVLATVPLDSLLIKKPAPLPNRKPR